MLYFYRLYSVFAKYTLCILRGKTCFTPTSHPGVKDTFGPQRPLLYFANTDFSCTAASRDVPSRLDVDRHIHNGKSFVNTVRKRFPEARSGSVPRGTDALARRGGNRLPFCLSTKKQSAAADCFFVEIEGLEPSLTEPESVVLPLHHISIGTANVQLFC